VASTYQRVYLQNEQARLKELADLKWERQKLSLSWSGWTV
jgi:hypothetical protein